MSDPTRQRRRFNLAGVVNLVLGFGMLTVAVAYTPSQDEVGLLIFLYVLAAVALVTRSSVPGRWSTSQA